MSDARETILRAAARCVARKGARGLRVLDVAKQAGVSSGLLYYHFTDRDGLLAATLEHINSEALGYRDRGDRPADATERLLTLLGDEIHESAEIRENSIAWNEIRATAVFDGKLAANLSRTTEKWQADIASAVREAQAAGAVPRDVDADEAAVGLTALVEGLSGRWLTGHLTAGRASEILRAAAVRLLR